MNKTAQDAYTHKVVICGNTIEFYEFQYPIPFNNKRDKRVGKAEKNNVERKGEKRMDNLYRARQKVRQIIWANITPHSKFLTLTTEKIVLNKKEFDNMLHNFFRQMKRYGYPLRYLYVLERQKERGVKEGNEGSLHAHIIVFNDEKIPLNILQKAWYHGRSELKVINGLRTENYEKVKDIGAYVCKYITKEAELEFGSRCYKCSIGLKRPIEQKVHGYKIDEKFRDSFYVPFERMQKYVDLKEMVKIKYSREGSYEIPCDDGTTISNTYKIYTGVLKDGQ